MRMRVALLSVLAFALLVAVATAAGPTPAALSLPNMTPLGPSACHSSLALPSSSGLNAGNSLQGLSTTCGSCSDFACVGAHVNNFCGRGLTCFYYGACSNSTAICVCAAQEP